MYNIRFFIIAQYSPVQSIAVKYWNVSATAINWLSLIYLLVYIPGVFCANVMLDLFGLRNYVNIYCLHFLQNL